jgi:hypothetical protein
LSNQYLSYLIVICSRYDITFAFNTLRVLNADPRKGRLERVYHLIWNLKKYPEKWIKMDLSCVGGIPGEDSHPFNEVREMNNTDAVEELDPKALETKGNSYKKCVP